MTRDVFGDLVEAVGVGDQVILPDVAVELALLFLVQLDPVDEKIEGVAILAPIVEGDGKEGRVDLSEIDFEKLAGLFAESPKVTAERLREEAEGRAKAMAARNPTRKPLVEKLEQLVAAYNAAIMGTEEYFEALQALIRSLDEEEARVAREGLDNEEQLAIFDLLTKPEPKLTKAQEIEVKAVARRLLDRLHELIDAVDWQRGQETRDAVWTELRMQLNALPEEPYPEPIWNAKVGEVWDFVLQRYQYPCVPGTSKAYLVRRLQGRFADRSSTAATQPH